MFYILLITIYVLCIVPIKDLPVVDFSYIDKIEHLLVFFLLTANFYFCYFSKIKFKEIFILLLSYGFLIEITQLFIKYRSFELLDLLADIAGIFLFFMLKYIIKITRKSFLR
jgi:VanZ family protein